MTKTLSFNRPLSLAKTQVQKLVLAGLVCLSSCDPAWSQLLPPTNPGQLPGQSPPSGKSPLAPSNGAAAPPSSKLTPEERQSRMQAQQQAAAKAEEYRMTTYGMISPTDEAPLAVAFRKASDDFKIAIADYTDAHVRIQHRLKDTLPDGVREKWLEQLRKSNQALRVYREAAAALYASDPEKYPGVGAILKEMLISDGKTDRLDHWIGPAKVLLNTQKLVDDEVLLYAGYAGLIEGDFELVKQTWSTLEASRKLGQQESILFSKLDDIKASWDKEQIRQEEDKSKNNPQVRVLTTKGEIVVELFEDDAPETVANFVYLVEQGYYTRKPFFFVKEHLLAQTGCEKGDGKGNAGYGVKPEADSPTRRSHFRGSLAMPVGVNNDPSAGSMNFAGAQFYFTFVPLPLADERNAVFGRVISGIEVLGLFKNVDLTDEEARKDPSLRPDTIIRVEVIRKRDHEYRPTPVIGRLPR
ncbi:MAG: peptidylprolyl isomerase [Pirellula sp.]